MSASLALVESREDTRSELVLRADPPPPGSGACLVVSSSQWAVLCGASGAPLVLDSGRHEIAWRDDYSAWFVSRRVVADMRWGTCAPVLFHDADHGDVSLRAHGRCALNVIQPATFVERIVTGALCPTTEDVEDRLRGTIAAELGAAMAGLGLPLAQLVHANARLASALAARVAGAIAPAGLGLPDLRVTAITPPEDVAHELCVRPARPPGALAPGHAGAAALDAAAACRPNAAGCRACGDTLPLGARFCPGCGHARGGDPCPECAAAQPADARYCPSCGITVPR